MYYDINNNQCMKPKPSAMLLLNYSIINQGIPVYIIILKTQLINQSD